MIKTHVIVLASLAFAGLYATQAQATACSQLGHWYWPQESEAKSFSGWIGNHGGVEVRYYMEAAGKVVEVRSFDYSRATTYVYHSGRNYIAVISEDQGLDAYTVEKGTAAYLPHLSKMRDLIGYAGAPEAFLADKGAEVVYAEALRLVNDFDAILKANDYLMPNCILNAGLDPEDTSDTCELTAGPVEILGNWDSRAQSVWVRDGFNFTLLQKARFDKSGGYETYSSWTDGSNWPEATRFRDGHFFVLKDQASLEASSVICQPARP